MPRKANPAAVPVKKRVVEHLKGFVPSTGTLHHLTLYDDGTVRISRPGSRFADLTEPAHLHHWLIHFVRQNPVS